MFNDLRIELNDIYIYEESHSTYHVYFIKSHIFCKILSDQQICNWLKIFAVHSLLENISEIEY